MEQAYARAQQNSGACISVLLKLMVDPATPASAKVRAALGTFGIAQEGLNLEIETRCANGSRPPSQLGRRVISNQDTGPRWRPYVSPARGSADKMSPGNDESGYRIANDIYSLRRRKRQRHGENGNALGGLTERATSGQDP
jgi:hypothetical protein